MPGWYKKVFFAAAFFALLPAALAQAQNAPDRGGAAAPGGGFSTLTGAEAEFYDLPGDLRLVHTMRLDRYGLTYERYQQFLGEAKVLGGQLTLYRDDSGIVTTVIGAHYADLEPSNSVNLSRAEAHGIVDRDIGPSGERITELMIDPETGRYFYWVETRLPTSRWILWIGAQGGQVINKYNALMNQSCSGGVSAPCGFGVEYDDGDPNDVKDLTGLAVSDGSDFILWSDAKRIGGYDYWDKIPQGIPIARDDDNAWVLPGDEHPAQPALVDGQYYGYLTSRYFWESHSYDWVAQSAANGGLDFMAVVVHAPNPITGATKYNNAFWNRSYISLGDGDQVNFRELTSLDVIAHELTHGVTDFTSILIYQNESGALNESFSDIMASSAEFYATANGLEPAGLPADWLIGEDIDLRGDTVPGIRNMADPQEDGHPDHYSELYTGSADNGGVHSNSGIPNHAYYLLVDGGYNASCASPGDHDSVHCTGGIGDGTPVTGIGIGAAESIFFLGVTALSSGATMCDARVSTEAIAAVLFPGPSLELASTKDAWRAVGLTDTVCGLTGNGAPAAGDDSAGTDEDTPVDIDVLGNDSDPDGDELSVASVTQGANGTVVSDGNSVTYTPDADFNGGDSFTYTASDGNGGSDEATVTVTVNAVNDAPSASFTYGCAGLACSFTSTSSDPDGDGTIQTYNWDFGDGSTSNGQNPIPNHVYTAPGGTYMVILMVTDDGGTEDGPASQEVTVSELTQDDPPTVSITQPDGTTDVGGKRVKIFADAADDIGVTQVEFFVNGGTIGVDTDGSDGWMARWDSKKVPDGGPYYLTAEATDTGGQTKMSAVRSVYVKNSKDSGGSDGGGGGKWTCETRPSHPSCS